MNYIRKYAFLFYLFFPWCQGYAVDLTVGVLTDSTQQISKEKNVLGYFELNLMKEICSRIRAECHFKEVFFHELSDLLSKEAIDLSVGAIIITQEKRKHFLFSLPYHESYLQYVTLSNSNIKNIQGLYGKEIGIYLYAPKPSFVLKQDNNKIHVRPVVVNNILRELRNKKIHAVLTDLDRAKHWVSDKAMDYRLLGSEFRVGEGYGIAAKLGREELMSQVNQALLDMEEDGTYLNIYQQFL